MKYILVSGGVISSIGKGVIASSIGVILKYCNIHVTSIKIDPYINIDAGTFSPYEHGEVYVLDDGSEVDLDLGNYERFMDVTLHRDNNITTGKIYQHVINKERRGDFLGKTVQVVPHITDAIQNWIQRVSLIAVSPDMSAPSVCVIELGGTIGDIESMPFVEAFRQFQFLVGRENFCSIHVSLVPQLNCTGEHKTKPTQAGVRELRGLGISPDLIVCRSELPVNQAIKQKISNFCHVAPHMVINVYDCLTIYHVPLILCEQGIVEMLENRLQISLPISNPKQFMSPWKKLVIKTENLRKNVNIALVGKYTELHDAYASLIKAITHSSLAVCRRLRLEYIEAATLEESTLIKDPVKYHDSWRKLCECDGLIIPGGFGPRGVEGMIKAAQWARTSARPFLGVCLGMHCAVIEFARNVLDLPQANSTEFIEDTPDAMIIDMPEHTGQAQMGATMRLGKRRTIFHSIDKSVLWKLYGEKEYIEERHRHRYEVNPLMIDRLEARGLYFVGRDADGGKRMEIMEIPALPYYVGVQFHPEYISRPMKPSPPFLGLILAATGKLSTYLENCSISEANSEENLEEMMENVKIEW